MATGNNIKNYTAGDIEKYHKGQLSHNEMHDMEKAALDDPFLADAMEGYSTPGVSMDADIADIKKRLEERTSKTKIIPLSQGKNKTFPLLRVAAILVLIAGAGLLTYQIAFNKKEKPLAKNDIPMQEVIKPADSSTSLVQDKLPGNPSPANNPQTAPKKNITEDAGKTNDVTRLQDNRQIPATENATGNETVSTVSSSPVAGAPAKPPETQTATGATEADKSAKKDLAKVLSDNEIASAESKKEKRSAVQNKTNVIASRKAEGRFEGQPSLLFRGRVTDVNNVGVPFANVTNPEENTGTYTDANGYFNLTYPDSVLNVQVRSIGFENRAARLKNNIATNKIVLKDDQNTLSEIIVGNKLPNSEKRSRDANRTLEEPEPADGWTNYDMYLANNLNPPDDYKVKPSSYPSVEVSFELGTNGEPTNFKIEKSLCAKCDKEAIRLIKEGPKWKQNASKHGRTKVTINF